MKKTKEEIIFGFDSAWSPKGKGAICAIKILDDKFELIHAPSIASFKDAASLVDNFDSAKTRVTIMIDQPTIVPNYVGMRPVEKYIARAISYVGGGVQPSNKSKISMFGADAEIWKFQKEYNFNLDPKRAFMNCTKASLVEVFPALALLSFNSRFFGRYSAPKYNPVNRQKFSLTDWHSVCLTCLRVVRDLNIESLEDILSSLRGLENPKKADQDKLDSIICVLIGAYWFRYPKNVRVFGDVDTGLILSPSSELVQAYLDKKPIKSETFKLRNEKKRAGKLSNVKVLDLSAFLPGPHATMMMADHGAEVIMVEPDNSVGEPTRAMGEKYADGNSVWFTNIARGKKSYKVNLKDAEQYAEFLTLATEADVFVEAFRPGVVKRLGVDYDAIKAINPGIIYCSISAFGQNGQYWDKPAHDLIVQAMAGTADLTRGMDGSPALTPMPSADMTASLHALSGILMALYRRKETGQGDYLDISMYDSLLSWVPNVTGTIFAEDRQPVREEMRSFGGNAFVNIYETQDGGHIVLGGSEPKFVANLLAALEAPELIGEMKKPVGQQGEVKEFLSKTFVSKTQADWETFLSDIDCCWSTIRTLHTALTEDGAPVTKAEGKTHINNPIRFQEEPAQLSFDLPEFGQQTAALKRGD